MTDPKIQLEWWDSEIACLKMQDEGGNNSFSLEFVELLTELLKELANNSQIKVLVLTGLPSVFCSGANLQVLKDIHTGKIKPVDIQLPKFILDIPVPVISAMQGHAIGGGFIFGLCADMVVLAEESRYGCSFMNMGFTPGMGTTKLMEHYMSPAVAHEMQYTGIFKKGRELQKNCNFNYILPKDRVLPQVEQMASAIAEKTRKSLVTLKRYLALPRRKMFQETYAIESMMHEISFHDPQTLKLIEDNYA